MDDISFGTIFWPALSALVTSVIIFETFQFCMNYWVTKRQMLKYLEMQRKIESGEIEMSPEMMYNMMPGMGGPLPPEAHPTVSGQGDDASAGQYL